MAGHTYVTHSDPNLLKDVAGRVGQGFEFNVAEVDAWTLKLQKGSLAASLFVGAFVAYCDFTVRIVNPGDGTQHLVLERNTPWWTGIFGVNRVKNRASELADAIGNELIARGTQIIQRIDF